MRHDLQPEALAAALLDGNRRALARAITQVENESPPAAEILNLLYPHTGRALRLGITGAPGTGKSSLVNALTKHLRGLGKTVGIVAVDPSSPFSQGAVLGDRIRMQDHTGDGGVFIRSMASRGSLGGLAPTTVDVVRVLDAAGFDVVIIETVGAGQNEVMIASLAQTTLVIEAPGFGDDIQANKAGILEIADVLVVNKADHPTANKTVQILKTMLDLGHRIQMVAHHGRMLLQQETHHEIDTWQVPVLKTVAIQDEGMAELYAAIIAHQAHLEQSQAGTQREKARLEAELAQRLQNALLDQFLKRTPPQQLDNVLQQIVQRELTPTQAVKNLLMG